MRRKDAGAQDGFPVIDKDFQGTGVYKHVQAVQAVFQAAGPCGAHVRAGHMLHAAAVRKEGMVRGVIAEHKAALSLCVGKQGHVQIGGIPVHFQLSAEGKGKTAGMVRNGCQLLISELFHLWQGTLDQLSIAQRKFPGQAQAAGPVLFICGIGGIWQAHPADNHGPVRTRETGGAGRRIKVKAGIQHGKRGFRCEDKGCPVHGPQKIPTVVAASGARGKRQLLRAEDQHIPPGYMLHGGTFPHASEMFIPGHLQLPCKGPAVHRALGGVDQYASVPVSGLRTEQDMPGLGSGVVKNLWITLVLRVVRMGSEQRRRRFFRMAVSVKARQAGAGAACPVQVPVVAGVVEQKRVSGGHGGTGIHAPVVEGIARSRTETDAQIFPGNKVMGNDVVPVFQAVNSAPGTPLVEKVPGSVKAGKAVGIVQEAGDGLVVEMLTPDGRRGLPVQRLQFAGVCEITVGRFPGPDMHGNLRSSRRPGLRDTFMCTWNDCAKRRAILQYRRAGTAFPGLQSTE